MPSQTFQHAASTPAAIGTVWKMLDEPRTWEAVPGVDRVVDPVVDAWGRLQGFSFDSKVGGKTHRGRADPAGREEQRLMAWDITTSEMKGKVAVGLSPADRGTRVYVRLDVDGVGMLGSLFFPVIATAIGAGFADTVDDFVESLGA
ncbi:MAG: SRPBCC family protein [Acidimicrobiia bacterium]